METPLHPAVVHFPIALLIFAGGLYLAELIFKQENLGKFGFISLVTGELFAIASIITGDIAEHDTVMTHEIHEIAELHETLGFVVAWIFGILIAFAFLRRNKERQAWEKWLFVAVAWIGIGIMGYSAHLGGEMVYEKGAGVEPMKPIIEQQRDADGGGHDHDHDHDHDDD